MTEHRNLHIDVLEKTNNFIYSLNIEQQLIKVLKLYQKKSLLNWNVDFKEYDNLTNYFLNLIEDNKVNSSDLNNIQDVLEKNQQYKLLKDMTDNRIKVTKKMLDEHNSLSSSLDMKNTIFVEDTENVLKNLSKHIESDSLIYNRLFALTQRIIDERNINVLNLLEERLMEVFKLVRNFYIEQFKYALGLFLNKKVFVKIDDFNNRFYFTQYMRKSDGDFLSNFCSFFKEGFEMSVFIKEENGFITELRKMSRSEYYKLGEQTRQLTNPHSNLNSFLIKHPELFHYVKMLEKVSKIKMDNEWINVMTLSLQQSIMKHKHQDVVNQFNELLIKEKSNAVEVSTIESKDIVLKDYMSNLGIELVIEERSDLIAKSYRYSRSLFRTGSKSTSLSEVKEDTRPVIVGFKSDKYLFV